MFENQLIDFEYLIIDSVRFIITFNCDFSLFEHWFWSYNFQNPSLFDTSGMFNEEHLRKEMLRIILIQKLFNVNYELICPTAELNTYWERHQSKIDKISSDIIDIIDNFKFLEIIQALVEKYLDNYKNDLKLNFDLISYMNKIDKLRNISVEIKEKQRKKLSFLFNNNTFQKNSVLEIEKLMFKTLKEHASSNKNKVTLLKRNWKTGSVLSKYNNLNKDILYAIDQTGGVYFYENDKINEYFKSNASCLLSLINFSFIKKKEFILEHQNNE